MKIELDFSKSLEQNAAAFFDSSKKHRKKLSGIKTALSAAKEQAAGLSKKSAEKKPASGPEKKRKKDWFEKFHWSRTSDGFLVIGGRDAKNNESIVKKFLGETDLFFHADIFGAPHCVLKLDGKSASSSAKSEAALFAAVFSKAWGEGIGSVDVYSAASDQVSKAAPTGESIGKGAFMVYGKREWFRNVAMEFWVGLENSSSGIRVFSGSKKSVEKNCFVLAKLVPGNSDKNKTAKSLLGLFAKKSKEPLSGLLLDELMAMIPNGASRIISE